MKLTRKEAIEQGYTKCGFDNERWQSVMDIDGLSDEDFDNPKGERILVFDKQAYSPSTDAESIGELIADQIACNHSDETGDDTDDVYDTVKALDFKPIADTINAALESKVYYMATDIELNK